MDIGVILENIAGLIGLIFELGVAIIWTAFKGALLVALVCVAILPFLIAAKIHVRRRRRQRSSAARARDKEAAQGAVLQEASPPAPPPEAAALTAALVRFIPAGLIDLLEDPEDWLLRKFPDGKGKLLVNLLGILGILTVGLGTALFGFLRLWAEHAPDLDDEHGSFLGSDEILEPNNMLDAPYPGADKPLVSKYLRPPRDGYWINR